MLWFWTFLAVDNFHFTRKIAPKKFGWKTREARENVVVLDFLAVDNFHFTRKIVKIEFLDKKLTFIIVCRVSHLFRMFLGVKKSVECFLRICSIWQSRWVKKNSLACSKNADKKGLSMHYPLLEKFLGTRGGGCRTSLLMRCRAARNQNSSSVRSASGITSYIPASSFKRSQAVLLGDEMKA